MYFHSVFVGLQYIVNVCNVLCTCRMYCVRVQYIVHVCSVLCTCAIYCARVECIVHVCNVLCTCAIYCARVNDARNMEGIKLLRRSTAVPLEAWTGPEGFRKLRFSDFVTTAQDGGKVVSLTHRLSLPPGNTPGTHFC